MTRLVKQTLMMVQKMQNWVKIKKWHLPESLFKTSCQKIAWLIRCIVGMSEYQWLAIRCPGLSCHRLRCRKNNCYRQMYVERWSTCWWFQRRLRPEKILSLYTSECPYRSFKVYMSRKQFHFLFSQRLPLYRAIHPSGPYPEWYMSYLFYKEVSKIFSAYSDKKSNFHDLRTPVLTASAILQFPFTMCQATWCNYY